MNVERGGARCSSSTGETDGDVGSVRRDDAEIRTPFGINLGELNPRHV